MKFGIMHEIKGQNVITQKINIEQRAPDFKGPHPHPLVGLLFRPSLYT